ncbi:MAG: hypothetical protein H6698_07370 [Myxococcales bacterium]|nr:hypothetical protein [Myxococcales bacterium]MCB9534126.1 hypothetical protein [Myxococcales bacterium]
MTRSRLASLCSATLLGVFATASCSDDPAEHADVGDVAVDSTSDGSGSEPDVVADAEADVADADAADVADGSGEPGDVGTDADVATDTVADVTPVPEYTRDVPAASTFPAPEGMHWVRSIVHLHSTHSHDACDGNPRPDGQYNLPCQESLRAALCDTKIDFAYLTDHPTHMVEVPFTDLLLHEPETDELLTDDSGRPYANRIHCPSGFVVTIRVGSEDRLMPLGMHEHVPGDLGQRDLTMNAYDPETVATMRATGALIWVAHTEQRTVEEMRPLGLDGLEIYQLHANIDPRIREGALGLDPYAPVTALFPFLSGTATTPPDLAVLAFLEPNRPSLDRWAALLAEGPMVGTGGTDAHENTFPAVASDGERLDSYRRMLSWFSNYVLTTDDTPEAVDTGLGGGHVVIGFDILGSIAGFDAHVTSGAARLEVGTTAAFEAGMTLSVDVPQPLGPSGIAIEPSCRALAADGEGWREVRAFGAGHTDVALAEAGIYRVECSATGAHLAPYLTGLAGAAERTYPWIYTNAFRLLPPA